MLNELFAEMAQKMNIDFRGITARIEHNGEKGTARENKLAELLRKYIPDQYALSKGIIIDYKDDQSKQVDIIIHDKMTTPYLLDMESTKIIPIESVYGVIEVKSRLTKEELRKAIGNIESVRRLPKKTISGRYNPTAGYIFAYDSDSNMETIYRNYMELSQDIPIDNQISCICILNKGLIVPVSKNTMLTIELFPSIDTFFAIFDDADNTLLMFYILLFHTLNSIEVFPPNMIEYAQSTGQLKTSLVIPSGYLPEDATFSCMGQTLNMHDTLLMQKYSQKFYSGELQQNEILEVGFGVLIPAILAQHGALENVPDNFTINYLGCDLSYKNVIRMYQLFQHKDEISPEELDELHQFEILLYKVYDNHREGIKRHKNK